MKPFANKKLYKPLDEYLENLKKKIRTEFNHLLLAGFDGLNILSVKRSTQDMFDRFERFNRDQYVLLVKAAWLWAFDCMGKEPPEMDYLDFVMEYLNGYDPITQYVYQKEIDRKRMRLNEAILTAREYKDQAMFEKTIKRAADLWYTQSNQYGIDLVNATIVEAYDRAGIDSVRWNTVIDGRECKTCRERNGFVYTIRNAPGRPHYGCRCYYTPA